MMNYAKVILLLLITSKSYADVCPNDYNIDIELEINKNDVLTITYTNKSRYVMLIPYAAPNIFLKYNGINEPFIGSYYYDKKELKINDYQTINPNKKAIRKIQIKDQYNINEMKTYSIKVPGGYYNPHTDTYYCGNDGVITFQKKHGVYTIKTK